MWYEGHNAHLFTCVNLDRAQSLIDAIAELDLQMILPRGLPTLCTMVSGNYTRPDNTFASSSLLTAVVHCNTVPEEQLVRSDHILVITVLNAALVLTTDTPRTNFRVANWE